MGRKKIYFLSLERLRQGDSDYNLIKFLRHNGSLNFYFDKKLCNSTIM